MMVALVEERNWWRAAAVVLSKETVLLGLLRRAK